MISNQKMKKFFIDLLEAVVYFGAFLIMMGSLAAAIIVLMLSGWKMAGLAFGLVFVEFVFARILIKEFKVFIKNE